MQFKFSACTQKQRPISSHDHLPFRQTVWQHLLESSGCFWICFFHFQVWTVELPKKRLKQWYQWCFLFTKCHYSYLKKINISLLFNQRSPIMWHRSWLLEWELRVLKVYHYHHKNVLLDAIWSQSLIQVTCHLTTLQIFRELYKLLSFLIK